MPTYKNGQLPASILVQLDSGNGKHWTTRASAARWYALRAHVKAEYGVTLKITEGWNAYRDLQNQHAARDWACSQGNCLGAAYPSTSSHGGNWYRPRVGWVDAMAFDVGNWWLLTWDAWVKACARFGLLAGGIPLNLSGGVDERHHIIDLNPFGPVPAGLEVKDLNDMGTLDNTEANYQVFSNFLQRALRYDVRPNGLGATYTLGPTIWEYLRAADDSADIKAISVAITPEDRADIARQVADAITLPAGAATKADVEAAVKAGLGTLVLKAG